VLNARNNLASLLFDLHRGEEALSIVTETLPVIRETLSPDHPYAAAALHIRAKALEQTGDRDGALAAFDELMRLCDSPDRKFPETLAEQYRQSRRRFLGKTD
jgi:tetratricopeptide (TPR) repeat protein